MTHLLSARLQPDYLHVTVTGDNTAEDIGAYLLEIGNMSVEHQRPRVLIEENLMGPSLRMSILFGLVIKAVQQVPETLHRIAYVDMNPQHDRNALQFAETVAVNRGVDVKFFITVAQALEWLLSPSATNDARTNGNGNTRG